MSQRAASTFTPRRIARAGSPGSAAPPACRRSLPLRSRIRPVRFILPEPPAPASTRSRARRSRRSRKALGHPVVVENQPGAGGIVGLQALVTSPPDGITLERGVEQRRDLPSVLQVACPSTCRATSRRSRSSARRRSCWSSIRQGAGQQREGVHRAAEGASRSGSTTPRPATAPSCTWRRRCSWTRPASRRTHIPYKGVGPMVTDLIGGQVDFGIAGAAVVQAHLKSGALRAIGTRPPQRAAGGARDPHLRRAGAAELRGRRLVRGDRAQGPARGRREAHSRRLRERLHFDPR